MSWIMYGSRMLLNRLTPPTAIAAQGLGMTITDDYIVVMAKGGPPIMKTMTITDFKAHALQVLSEVAARKEKVVVTKRGKPLVEVSPYSETEPTAGRLAEALVFEEDILSPLGDEMWDACR